MTCRTLIGCALCLIALESMQARAGVFSAGRTREQGRDFRIDITAGQIQSIEAIVQETTRKLYDVTGETFKQEDAENYDLNDFDMDDGYPMIGVSMEKMWKYFTFQLDASFMQPDTETVARRNYYIEVDEVKFNGQTYEHMKIPEGTPFDIDAVGGTLELRGLITFFTIEPSESLRITPWIDIGLFGFAGEYDIDAGPASDLVQYQNPPEDFVVGGKATGYGGVALPEIGLGGEIRFGSRERLNLVIDGHYAVCEYDGSSKYFTTNDHREKNLDLEHENLRLRCRLEIPLKSSRCLTFGLQYQLIDSEAFIESGETDPEEILEARERFDKEVQFELETLQATLGLTF